jgi:hypothetical protein
MAGEVKEVGAYSRLTASGLVVAAGGTLLSFICTTAGTLKISEKTDGSGPDIVSQISVSAGVVYPFGFRCPNAAYATLGGGAAGTFVG